MPTNVGAKRRDHLMDEMSELFDKGLEIRKAVLGPEYVDRAIANASEFTTPLQEFVTAYAWGAVWGRDGLDRKVRSFINLAMLTALNRQHELGLHVRGALRNGCSVEEIREVLLQTAVYAGVPASIEAFRTAEAIINEEASS
jgi:4-carboxymuconolactone decarboxylase